MLHKKQSSHKNNYFIALLSYCSALIIIVNLDKMARTT